MFSTEPRCIYKRSPLREVICQLRFPEILSIGEHIPADFQETIRQEFPQYAARKEVGAPRISGVPGAMRVEEAKPTVNYQFTSADGVWKVNLTTKFISLSCSRYTCWEDFAKMLDKPLASFIKLYQPAYFERLGLRYVNFISRRELSLEGVPFRELIDGCYLGVLALEDVSENSAARCSMDTEVAIQGGCRAKIHAGPGLVKNNGIPDPEVKFIFDQDLFMPGKLPVHLSAGALQTLHSQAYSIFRFAITDTLHDALEPTLK